MASLSDDDIVKGVIGLWSAREYASTGMLFKYLNLYRTDGTYEAIGTRNFMGVTEDYRNAGKWWVKGGLLTYTIDQTTIKEACGLVLSNNTIAHMSENTVVYANVMNGCTQYLIHERIPNTLAYDPEIARLIDIIVQQKLLTNVCPPPKS